MKSVIVTLILIATQIAYAQAPNTPQLPNIQILPSKAQARHNVPAIEIAPPEAPPVVNWDAPPVTSFKQSLTNDGLTTDDAQMFQDLIYQESKKRGVPADVLFASIYQESDFQHYGVNLDYGNYSCGISQINISGWCQTIAHSPSMKKAFGWPGHIRCNDLQTLNAVVMGPFLTSIQAARTLEESGTEPTDFATIKNNSTIQLQMPGKDAPTKQRIYEAALSFGLYCSDPRVGVVSMARSLKEIYRDYIPKELKGAHPHTAWVVANAIYNIGPVLIAILKQNGGADVWLTLTPQRVIDVLSAVYATRPSDATNTTTFSIVDGDGETQTVKYFQTCVNQRHIAHILQASMPAAYASAIRSSTEDCGQ